MAQVLQMAIHGDEVIAGEPPEARMMAARKRAQWIGMARTAAWIAGGAIAAGWACERATATEHLADCEHSAARRCTNLTNTWRRIG